MPKKKNKHYKPNTQNKHKKSLFQKAYSKGLIDGQSIMYDTIEIVLNEEFGFGNSNANKWGELAAEVSDVNDNVQSFVNNHSKESAIKYVADNISKIRGEEKGKLIIEKYSEMPFFCERTSYKYASNNYQNGYNVGLRNGQLIMSDIMMIALNRKFGFANSNKDNWKVLLNGINKKTERMTRYVREGDPEMIFEKIIEEIGIAKGQEAKDDAERRYKKVVFNFN